MNKAKSEFLASEDRSGGNSSGKGFTLIEVLIGGTVMLIMILATLALYMDSNKITVDQQQFAELQNDVRAGMFFLARDVRHAGAGLPEKFSGYYMEGIDNENQGATVQPDRIKIMGNIEDPLGVTIDDYQGSAANAALVDFSFEQYHYTDAYYDNRYVIIFPNPASDCMAAEVRIVTDVTHSATGTNERFNFSPGLAPGVDPPGGLSGTCESSNDYDGGLIAFVEIKEYWLDVTGNYPGLTAGLDGYIGGGTGGILYLTQNNYHYPMAQNIENLQFEYRGDFDDDLFLDDWQDWNPAWNGDPVMVSRIHQVRIWVLGRTPNPFVSVSGTPPADIHLYRRPEIANSPSENQDDKHRRFLLRSSAIVRNKSLNIYNTGKR